MDKHEIALQITLKAIEGNLITVKCSPIEQEIEELNAFNSKQIADFYNSVYSTINTEPEVTAQIF